MLGHIFFERDYASIRIQKKIARENIIDENIYQNISSIRRF